MVQTHGAAYNFLDLPGRSGMQGLQRAESPYIEKLYVDLSGVTNIFGQCLASMKAKFYNYDIVLNGNGSIENSQCSATV